MAKSRIAIVPKTPASPDSNSKQAPAQPAPELMLPASVCEVLYNIQNQLLQVKGIFASAYALAEANDDSSDVRWAMEAALELFDSAIESVEPASVSGKPLNGRADHGQRDYRAASRSSRLHRSERQLVDR